MLTNAKNLQSQLLRTILDNYLELDFSLLEKISKEYKKYIFVGVGKSAFVAQKLTASLASYGVETCFVHASDAVHGDLGHITTQACCIVISYSGNTSECVRVAELTRARGVYTVAFTANTKSQLASVAHDYCELPKSAEFCRLGIAPTTSIIATLMVGDLLNFYIAENYKIAVEDFLENHPGGGIATSLNSSIIEKMISLEEVILTTADPMLDQVLEIINANGHGCVIGQHDEKWFVITDGDLRRSYLKNEPFDIVKHASFEFKTIISTASYAQARNIITQHRVNFLVVVNEKNDPIGIVK